MTYKQTVEAIKAAIKTSMSEDRTVVCEIDRGDLDNAALSVEIGNAWASMEPAGDTDWDDDKDGGVRVWGWIVGVSGDSLWTIIVR